MQIIRHYRVDTAGKQRAIKWLSASVLLDTDQRIFRVITRRPPQEFNKSLARRILTKEVDCIMLDIPFTDVLEEFDKRCSFQTCDIDTLMYQIVQVINGKALELKNSNPMKRSYYDHLINAIIEIKDTREKHQACEDIEDTFSVEIDRETFVIKRF